MLPIETKRTDAAARKPTPAHAPLRGHQAPVAASEHRSSRRLEEGRVGWVLLWLLGIPVPILLGAYFLRGCT